MSDPADVYEQLCQHVRKAAMLGSIESLLGWDERCLMPSAGAEYRADQMTLLSGLVHEQFTDPRLGDWLAELSASPLASDPASDAGTVIRQMRRKYEREVKLPKSLVEELTRTSVLGQQAWQDARRDSDFGRLAPLLERTISLKRQQAEAIGYEACPYDALLDDYEQGATAAELTEVLGALRDELVPLVAEVATSKRAPDTSILERRYPIEMQQRFGRQVAERIGFSFERGRLDVTPHPFCSSLGPHDCRITTRYNERFFNEAFFGVLHEAGHGLYDQGLRPDLFGLPPGEAVSMGIHESQSRMWENLVGRSKPFWQHWFEPARQAFPDALSGVSLDEFYSAINVVRPSLIRVEADEGTYNLHILIRFELEQELLDRNLKVADLPSAWNAKYQQYLGIVPSTDAEGVLQDIHWSAGLIGYFPTYSLGNLYAAQLFAQADADLGGLAVQFARGQFDPLRQWLTTRIHQRGQCHLAAELVQEITGQPLSHAPLVTHLRNKFGPLYGLNS